MLNLPDEVEISPVALAVVLFLPLSIMTIVTMFIIGPALSLGLVAIMAITAGIVWLGSRGTDWMEPLDDDGELE